MYELIEHAPKTGQSPTIWAYPGVIEWMKVAGQPVAGPWPPHQQPRPDPDDEPLPVAITEPEPRHAADPEPRHAAAAPRPAADPPRANDPWPRPTNQRPTNQRR